MSFVTLSNGDVFPGGLLAITIAASDSTVMFEAGIIAIGQDSAGREREREVLIDHITSAQFAYYGAFADGAPAQWHKEWNNAEVMPRAVRIRGTLLLSNRSETMNFTFRLPGR